MFRNLQLEVPKTSGINKTQLSRLKKLLDQRGGVIVEESSLKDDEKAKTGAILTSKPKLYLRMAAGKCRMLPVITPDWISDSIEQGQRLPLPSVKRMAVELGESDPASGEAVVPAAKIPKTNLHTEEQKDDSLKRCHKLLIIQEFTRLLQRHRTEKDANGRMRVKAYETAINAISNFAGPVTSAEDVKVLKGIGFKSYEKIQEIVRTGYLAKNLHEPEGVKEMLIFQRIHGVGVSVARKWYEQLGLRTLDDVKNKVDRNELQLTASQLKGLKYVDDFEVPIPRSQVESIFTLVKVALTRTDPGMDVMLLGSYRRGKQTSSDVDILIFPRSRNDFPSDDLIKDLVSSLKTSGLLIDDLLLSDKVYNGVCRFNNLIRRIDFLLCSDYKERGSYQLHFTGGEHYNRYIRYHAQGKGMKLSQHGLYKRGATADERGDWVAGETEEDIMAALGLPWIKPEDRGGHNDSWYVPAG